VFVISSELFGVKGPLEPKVQSCKGAKLQRYKVVEPHCPGAAAYSVSRWLSRLAVFLKKSVFRKSLSFFCLLRIGQLFGLWTKTVAYAMLASE
jgi:hypothetical protein